MASEGLANFRGTPICKANDFHLCIFLWIDIFFFITDFTAIDHTASYIR